MNEAAYARLGIALRWLGAGVAARLLTPRDNLRVVVIHGVRPEELTRFAACVDLLLRDRRPVTPADVVSAYDGSGPPLRGRTLLFTFDDGLLSSHDAARRVLDPLGIKAVFFVPTRILELETDAEQRAFFADAVYHGRKPAASLVAAEYRTMTAERMRELYASGHAVMSHTYSHRNISEVLSAEDVERELAQPRRVLEELMQAPAPAFAFPVGTAAAVTPYAYDRVRTLYSLCFTGLIGANSAGTDPHVLRRDSVHPRYSREHLRALASGAYDLPYRLKLRRLER